MLEVKLICTYIYVRITNLPMACAIFFEIGPPFCIILLNFLDNFCTVMFKYIIHILNIIIHLLGLVAGVEVRGGGGGGDYPG